MTDQVYLTAIVPENFAGWRLDRTLAEVFPDYSRSSLKNLILDGKVHVNQQVVRPRSTVSGGEKIEIWIEPEEKIEWLPQDISLNILYEDEDLIVINKPAGLVVHPGAGNPDRTLVNALLFHDRNLSTLPRAGIVHRLDKDTTGVMVVARSLRAHTSLIKQLQSRQLKREYQAIVVGNVIAGGAVEAPLGRHPTQRTCMAVTDKGKPAVTHYRVERKFKAHTHLRLQLETGRTHQIRVHMAHIGFPLVGDPVYGGRLRIPKDSDENLIRILRNFKRQALHSTRLELKHPETGLPMSWEAPLPTDLSKLIAGLRDNG